MTLLPVVQLNEEEIREALAEYISQNSEYTVDKSEIVLGQCSDNYTLVATAPAKSGSATEFGGF